MPNKTRVLGAVILVTSALVVVPVPVAADISCGAGAWPGASSLSCFNGVIICPSAVSCCDGTGTNAGGLTISATGYGLVSATADCLATGTTTVLATVTCTGINFCTASITIGAFIKADLSCYTNPTVFALYQSIQCDEQ